MCFICARSSSIALPGLDSSMQTALSLLVSAACLCMLVSHHSMPGGC